MKATNTDHRAFPEEHIRRIKDKLAMISHVTPTVQYLFFDNNSKLLVTGLHCGDRTFVHSRGALDALEMYMTGYDDGFGDGTASSKGLPLANGLKA